MPTLNEVVRNRDFQQLPFEERRKVLIAVDDGFKGLSQDEQIKALIGLKQKPFWNPGNVQQPTNKPPSAINMQKDDVGAWGREHPNLYALKEMGKDFVNAFNPNTPTAPATSVEDWTTRVLPESVTKFPGRVLQGGYEMVKGQTDPLVSGLYNTIVNNQPAQPISSQMRKNAVNAVTGTGAAMTKGIGFGQDANGNITWSPENAKEAWATDPFGSLAGLVPLINGTPSAVADVKAIPGAARNAVARTGMKPNLELQKLSELHDVPLTVGEVTAKPGIVNLETQLERVPTVGTRKFRMKQSQALNDAASRLVDNYTPEVIDNLPENIQGNMLNTLANNKREVNAAYSAFRNSLAESGVPDAIAPTQTRAAAQSLMDASPDLFRRLPGDNVESKIATILEDTGENGQIQPMTFTDALSLREKLNDYLGRAYQSRGAVGSNEMRHLSILKGALDKDIENWGSNLDKTPIYRYQGALADPGSLNAELTNINQQIAEINRTAPKGNLVTEAQKYYAGKPQMMRMVAERESSYQSRLLNQYAKDTGRSEASAGGIDPNSANGKRLADLQARSAQIQDALNGMTEVDQSTRKGVVDSFKSANQLYQDKVVPFLDQTIKRATKDDFDTDTLLSTFVKPNRPELARKMMESLDEQGQQMARYAVLKQAFDKAAATEAKTGGKVVFSPARFAKSIEDMGSTIYSVFGKDADLLKGFAKLSRAAERAGQFAENPPTGLRASDTGISMGIIGGMWTHPILTGSTLGALKTLSTLLTTEGGKRILLKSARTPVKSPGFVPLLQQLEKAWPQLATQAGELKDKIRGKLKDDRGLFAPFGGDINELKGQFSDLTDRKAKYEIDDSGAKLKDDFASEKPAYAWVDTNAAKGKVLLGDILDHPDLYKRFPDLANMPVELKNLDSANASYSPTTKSIDIGNTLNWKNTLTHEIQHAIQDKGGFARGGSPEAMAVPRDQAMVRINFLNSELSRLAKLMDVSKGEMYDAAKSTYDTIMNEKMRLWDQSTKDPYQQYRHLAGEEEARRTAARFDMGAQERMGRPYDRTDIENPQDLIVTMKNGQQKSVVRLTDQDIKELNILRPAVHDGKLYTGTVGESHHVIAVKNGAGEEYYKGKMEVGFVTPNGEFLTRGEVSNWLRKNDPETYKALTNKHKVDSVDYAYSKGLLY